jgi:L-threonine-O-3-phosphate decarboxylase
MSAYHGGNLESLAERSGRSPETLLDFSANLNPLGTPAVAIEALRAAVSKIDRYPDPANRRLRHAIARHLALDPDRIVAGNGAEQLIWWLPRLLKPPRVLLVEPCYIDYRRSAQVWSVPVVSFRLAAGDGFALDLDRLVSIAKPGDLVWIGQPNNPTGRLVDTAALQRTIGAHPEIHWAIDEAFIDFVDGAESAVHWEQPNMVVVRSMTKFYALAGVRLGYAVTSVARAAELAALLPEWSVNHLASEAGVAVLDAADRGQQAQRTRRLVCRQRDLLSAALRRLGCRVFAGAANYLLLQLPDERKAGTALAQRLLRESGIAVRVCDNYPGLDDSYLRIAVRAPADNQCLIRALTDLLGV